MASDDAKRLRAEVQRRLKSVNSKIARTKRTSGADIAGTQFDPRRRAGVEKSYNAKQLRTYLSNLNDFMRRTNQFVAGSSGPIPRGKFNLYKQVEAQVRAKAVEHAQSITGYSFDQRKSVAKSNAELPGPFTIVDREPSHIKDAKALDVLFGTMNKQLKQDFMSNTIRRDRANLDKAFEKMGDDGIRQELNSLSDYQFDVLTRDTNFVESAYLKYNNEMKRIAGTRKEAWQDRMIDDAYNDMADLLGTVRSEVPTNRPT